MTTTALHLYHGNHAEPPAGCTDPEGCLWELYNWRLGSPWGDQRPEGVSPVLHIMGLRLNDCLPDDRRQELAVYLPNGASPLAGTADAAKDHQRSLMALDWLIRIYLPAWLALVPALADHAAALAGLAPVTDDNAAAAGPVVRAAGDAAWAAAAAAWDAAGDAAWDAAGDAAGDAARAAAVAAWAAGDAAAAAGEAAWTAAWTAAGDAAWDAAGEAARAAAGDVLQPTVDRLQTSALALYAAMVAL
jgi:hypothetical protein